MSLRPECHHHHLHTCLCFAISDVAAAPRLFSLGPAAPHSWFRENHKVYWRPDLLPWDKTLREGLAPQDGDIGVETITRQLNLREWWGTVFQRRRDRETGGQTSSTWRISRFVLDLKSIVGWWWTSNFRMQARHGMKKPEKRKHLKKIKKIGSICVVFSYQNSRFGSFAYLLSFQIVNLVYIHICLF